MSVLGLLLIFTQTPTQALTPAPTAAPTQTPPLATQGATATACECSGEDCKWKPPASCAPTFTYKGKVYHGCSMVDSHRAWCSHNSNHTNQWSFCEQNCEDGCHVQQMPAACIPGNGPAIGHADEACDCMHATCAWMPPANCSENFTYHGSAYSGCALVDDAQAWCAHNKIYQPKEWSHCQLRCPEGCYWHHPRGCLKKTVEVRLPVNNVCWEPPSSCAPKFRYKGQEYAGCTTADSGPHAWCSHKHEYKKNSWDYCKARACCNHTQRFALVPEKADFPILISAPSLKYSQQHSLSHRATAGLCLSSILGGGLLIGGVVTMRAAKRAQKFERIDDRSNSNFNKGGFIELE